MSAARPRGPGRRPGGPDTRSEILRAARQEFAERSFARTTVRAIAVRAGVDPALVHHYFGTKQGLFTASLDLSIDPGQVLRRLGRVPPEQRGATLARIFFEVWDDAERRAPFVALIRSAMTEPAAADVLRQLAEQVIGRAVLELVDGEEAELRLQLAVSQMIGAALLRHVIGAEPLRSAPVEELVTLVGPVVQNYFEPGRH